MVGIVGEFVRHAIVIVVDGLVIGIDGSLVSLACGIVHVFCGIGVFRRGAWRFGERRHGFGIVDEFGMGDAVAPLAFSVFAVKECEGIESAVVHQLSDGRLSVVADGNGGGILRHFSQEVHFGMRQHLIHTVAAVVLERPYHGDKIECGFVAHEVAGSHGSADELAIGGDAVGERTVEDIRFLRRQFRPCLGCGIPVSGFGVRQAAYQTARVGHAVAETHHVGGKVIAIFVCGTGGTVVDVDEAIGLFDEPFAVGRSFGEGMAFVGSDVLRMGTESACCGKK